MLRLSLIRVTIEELILQTNTMSTTTDQPANWQQKLRERYNGLGSGERYDLIIDGQIYSLNLAEELSLEKQSNTTGQCQLIGDLATFEQLFRGQLSATSALLKGKIKIEGDLGAAMRFKQFFTN